MEIDNLLLLSGIQHFAFCRRQWALIHIEQKWSDNYLTVDGSLKHKRVHDNVIKTSSRGTLTIRGLHIKSNLYGVVGNCDAVEFVKAEDGISLQGKEGLWHIHPIEYKRGKKKASECDRVQLVLQAICLEEMFCTEVREGYIFYFENRRRVRIDISDDDKKKVKDLVNEMRSYYDRGYTPKATYTKKCDSCSLKSDCLPELMGQVNNVQCYLQSHIKELTDEENA